jgi:hypothetical protein
MVRERRGSRAVLAMVLLLAIVLALFALTGCGGTKTVTNTVTETTTVSTGEPSGLATPRQRIEFGTIRSLKRVGDRYEMSFDPALMLMGETANRAAQEDGVVGPGEPVPNDNYVVNESKRTYTYFVADDAKVTLLVRTTPEKWAPTKESVSELAKVVAGTSALDLFEPLDSGTWITVDVDTVRAVYQQYAP